MKRKIMRHILERGITKRHELRKRKERKRK